MLEYTDTDQAIQKNVDNEDKITISELLYNPVCETELSKHLLFKNEFQQTVLINESGFYSIILASKKEEAKKI